MTALEETISAVAARYLRGSGGRSATAVLEVDKPLELLGLDSLASIELVAALEDELGCELPDDLLSGCADVRTLARRLAWVREQGGRRPIDPVEQMIADAALPAGLDSPLELHPDTGLRNARCILLTGAAGFLGSALLRELLDTSPARIVCLVRATSAPLSLEDARVRTVIGDICQPRLGLDETNHRTLIGQVDAICHAAAAVDWIHSYAALRDANVTGTVELLRLAFAAGAPFHFVSSLSTCYSTSGPRHVDESFNGLPELRGFHLGYAQTKVIAEALVRAAGARGLPIRIYRPALISGHSCNGAFNSDDIITALIKGCVRMGVAPDLDWQLDSHPVDFVANAIVTLSAAADTVYHLGHPKPRHWRDCVLWMRMYGYDIRLVSYHAWLRQLERDTLPDDATEPAHPLRALRSFFLHRPANARGLTLPELYEERRRTAVSSACTHVTLAAAGATPIPLDASLLDTYFRAFRAAGELPPPTLPGRTNTQDMRSPVPVSPLDPAVLSRAVGCQVQRLEILSSGSDHSIVSELTAWRSRRPSGLFRARLHMDIGEQDVFVKLKARDEDVIAVGEALAALVDPAVGRAYRQHADRAGFTGSHQREIAIYRQTDWRVTRHVPRVLGTLSEESSGTWMAVLEDVSTAAVVNSADRTELWRPAEIGAAIDGLAALHSVWLGRDAELRRTRWIGHVPNTCSMTEMTGLWTALAGHAAPYFAGWADPDIAQIHERLVKEVEAWWPALEAGPQTLIHNDFNPRNICLRRAPSGRGGRNRGELRLCAYDWELATLGAPQRDLAEFLCFVLTDTNVGDAPSWIERHRLALEREAGVSIDPHQWTQGFRSGVYDLLINRLATYAVVHRVRRQSFLPRVVATWRILYELFPLKEWA
ncbi:MAG: thioester reductase domain-containing protein [Vicinamibacterales bacterium]